MRKTALALTLGLALALGTGCSDDPAGTILDGSVLPDIGTGSEAGVDNGGPTPDNGVTPDQKVATPDSGPSLPCSSWSIS